MSSRLVALGPPAIPSAEKSTPSPAANARAVPIPAEGPPSPAQGLAQTFSGIDKLLQHKESGETEKPKSGVRTFLAAIGQGIADGIEFIYLKLARYVPPNL